MSISRSACQHTVLQSIWHYSRAISLRLFLLMEALRLKKAGRNIPAYIYKMTIHRPTEAEDWINLLCFFDESESILLIDIGANIGEFSRGFRKLFKNSHIIAFEPTAEAFKALNFAYQDDNRFLAVNAALSDDICEEIMYVPKESKLSSFMEYTAIANEHRNMDLTKTQNVAVRTLDSYQPTIDKIIDGVSAQKVFLKIDVQGHEINVLRGGRAVLEKVDVVLCECTFAPVYKGISPSFSQVCSMLSEHSFYPIIFQEYGFQISNYAAERDVIFVKPYLFGNMFFFNHP